MADGKQFFSTDEIRALAERSDLWGGALLVHCWGVIGAAVAVFALWPSVLTFVLAVAVIGSRQLGLAILMHEAAHNALFRTPRLNEIAGEWLCGRPILADLAAYRRYHLKHHKHTQTEADPDLVLSRPFPTTRASLRRKLLRDIMGRTGFRLRLAQLSFWLRMAGDDDARQAAEQDMSQAFNGPGFGRSLLMNAVLFAVMWALGDWWWWLAFWALPLLTWYQLVLRVRNIAEHGVTEFSDNPLRNVRTTQADPLTAFFLAPYWVNYHLEHHLVMHVPCRNLPRMHRLMLDRGHAPDMEIGESYWTVLTRASSRPMPG